MEPRIHHGERRVSSINGAKKNRNPYTKE